MWLLVLVWQFDILTLLEKNETRFWKYFCLWPSSIQKSSFYDYLVRVLKLIKYILKKIEACILAQYTVLGYWTYTNSIMPPWKSGHSGYRWPRCRARAADNRPQSRPLLCHNGQHHQVADSSDEPTFLSLPLLSRFSSFTDTPRRPTGLQGRPRPHVRVLWPDCHTFILK